MDERVKKIVGALKKGTVEHKLDWERTEREKEYLVNLTTGAITVDSWENYDDLTGDGESYVDIGFLSKTGEVIDRVVFSQASDFSDFREIANLHDAARRSHLKVDEKLDSILTEIEKKLGSTEN